MLPADLFHLRQRGRLLRDYFADIVIFKPENVKECATYERPYLPAQGIAYTLVNGQVVFAHENALNVFPGRYLA